MVLLRNSFFWILIISLFSACTNKAHFIPNSSNFEKEKRIPFIFTKTTLKFVGNNQVLLSDNRLIDSHGKKVIKNSETSDLINDEVVLTKNKNFIAYVTENNSIVLFDIVQKQVIFSEKFPTVITIDRRLPKPLFEKDSILYFTLDGKIAVYSIPDNKISRVISVNDTGDYSNIISYQLSENSLILLTHKKLLLISDNYDDNIIVDIRGAIFQKDNFYLITKNGEIRNYDYKLSLQKQIKFPFAYFIAFGKVKEKIYLIESQGYIIEIDSDLDKYRVIDSELDDENCFFTEQKFICDEKFFRLPLSI